MNCFIKKNLISTSLDLAIIKHSLGVISLIKNCTILTIYREQMVPKSAPLSMYIKYHCYFSKPVLYKNRTFI